MIIKYNLEFEGRYSYEAGNLFGIFPVFMALVQQSEMMGKSGGVIALSGVGEI